MWNTRPYAFGKVITRVCNNASRPCSKVLECSLLASQTANESIAALDNSHMRKGGIISFFPVLDRLCSERMKSNATLTIIFTSKLKLMHLFFGGMRCSKLQMACGAEPPRLLHLCNNFVNSKYVSIDVSFSNKTFL